MPAKTYEVAILGGGPGGYAAALRAKSHGLRVCCIEKGYWGGVCLNRGCIPTKAMLQASELAWHFRHGEHFGIRTNDYRVKDDFSERIISRVLALRKGLEQLLRSRGVELISGVGKIEDAHTVIVDGGNDELETVHAQHLILATGSWPILPKAWQGMENLWTPDQAAEQAILPESVLIVGGGICGCEFATVYSELGIPTVLVEQQDRLLAGWDPLASQAARESLVRRGVKVILNTTVDQLDSSGGKIQAILSNGEALKSHGVLAALGRKAQLPEGPLEQIALTQQGALPVDEFCRTAIPQVYAVGDVTDRGSFAHTALRMGTVAADHIAGCAEPMEREAIPRVVYTHPVIAEVGLSEEVCLAEGGRVERFPLRALGKSHLGLEDSGWMKCMTDAQGRIQGATVVAPHAEELIAEMALAIRGGLTLQDVANTIHPHPSFSEGWMEAAMGSLGLPLHYIPRTHR